MMNVWIITHWSLNGVEETTEVIGVFSTVEKAKAYLKELNPHPANSDYIIKNYDVDALVIK